MEAEQSIWLHNQPSLLPGSNQPGKQDKEDAIGPGERWPFHLPPQNDKLLA
jgi:hypothetical protein